MLLAIGLFFVVPVGLTSLIKDQLGSSLLFWLVEGVLRTAIFIGYILAISKMPDLRRVFEYHGAEHKTISCYEAEDELVPARAKLYSRLHPRCGTSFLLIVMVLAIFVFAPIGVMIAVIATWVASAAAVVVWGTRDRARASDAIVVLGAAQYVGRPSPVLRARLDHALDLWHRGLAPRLIVTGGMGVGDTTSEAAVSRNYALRHGVPGYGDSHGERGSHHTGITRRGLDHHARAAAAQRDPGERPVPHAAPPRPIDAVRRGCVHVTHKDESDLGQSGAGAWLRAE